MNPDDAHDADHLLSMMEDAAIDVSATVQGAAVIVHATDEDGQVYRFKRDDGRLVACLLDAMMAMGFEDLDG
jgi:hypothetical protein